MENLDLMPHTWDLDLDLAVVGIVTSVTQLQIQIRTCRARLTKCPGSLTECQIAT